MPGASKDETIRNITLNATCTSVVDNV